MAIRKPGCTGPMTRPRRPGGFTLVELLLGLVVLSLVGLAVACMLNAVAYGTASSRDMRSLVGRQDIIATRLSGAIASAHQVLVAEAGVLVLWTRDTNGDGKPDADEIERIDTQGDQLWAWTPNSDTGSQSYALTSDFAQISANLKASHDLSGQCWATGISNWTPSVDTASPSSATLVNWRITLEDGLISEAIVQATALRRKEGA